MRKISTSVYLDIDQCDALEEVSRKANVSKAEIIRRGIDLALNEFEDKIEAQKIGMKTIRERRKST